jgi:hypothetical protein
MDTAGDDRPRLYLRVASGEGQAISLDEWMSFITDELTGQKAAIRQLIRQSADLKEELAALRSSITGSRLSAQGLRGASADLRQRMDDLDRRLNKILALVEESLGGGQTEQAIQHHDFADEYTALVEQKITGLALDILPEGTRSTPREKAVFVAAVCADLFQAPEVLEQQLIGRLPDAAPEETVQRMRDICAEARDLRAKVAHGRPQRWEFGCRIAAPVDDHWQELWTGAAHDGVIDFVVTPAYFVDSNVLLRKQKVFTVEAGPVPDTGPAGP